MGRWVLLFAVALIAVAAGMFWLTGQEVTQHTRPAVSEPAVVASLPPAESLEERAVPLSQQTAPVVPLLALAGDAGASGTSVEAFTTITARLVRPDGRPASNVPWVLNAWPFHDDTREVAWRDVVASTDVAGQIVVRFLAPPGYAANLEAWPEDYAHVRWTWPERDPSAWTGFEPGTTIDLGDVLLEAGYLVEARVLDGLGELIRARPDWRASVRFLDDLDRTPTGLTRYASRNYVLVGPDADGVFRFDHLPARRMRVDIMPHLGPRLRSRVFDPSAESDHRLDIVYDGPPLDQRIVLRMGGEDGVPFIGPEREHIRLIGQNIGLRHPEPQSRWRYAVFENVPPGVYTLEVHDGLHDPWVRHDITPNSQVDIVLVGNVSMEVVVTRARDATPLESFMVGATCSVPVVGKPGASRGGNRHLLSELGPHLGGRVRFHRFMPANYDFRISAPGFLTGRVSQEAMSPGGAYVVEVALREAARIGGVVVDGHGAPVVGVPVGLYPVSGPHDVGFLPIAEDSAWWPVVNRTREQEVTETDSEGRFLFDTAPEGNWTVRAYRSATLDALLEGVAVASGDKVEDLQLVLAPD